MAVANALLFPFRNELNGHDYFAQGLIELHSAARTSALRMSFFKPNLPNLRGEARKCHDCPARQTPAGHLRGRAWRSRRCPLEPTVGEFREAMQPGKSRLFIEFSYGGRLFNRFDPQLLITVYRTPWNK